MPIYERFLQLDPKAFLPFNDSPSHLLGKVWASDSDELVIEGRAIQQTSDWYNIGGRTRAIAPHSFTLSVTASPSTPIGAYSLGIIGLGRPSINISHFIRNSVGLHEADIGGNFYSGFGFDDAAKSYEDYAGRTQRGVVAPFDPLGHHTLSVGYDADRTELWCSANSLPIHRIRASLGQFVLELRFEAVGVGGDFEVRFGNLYYFPQAGGDTQHAALLGAWDPQYAAVFVSYAHSDSVVVAGIAQRLRREGVRVLADWDFKAGDSLSSVIGTAVSRSGYMLVMLSKASVASRWVQKELEAALASELESSGRVKVVPVLIEDCEIPAFLRGKLHVDMRHQNPAATERLMRTLRSFGDWTRA